MHVLNILMDYLGVSQGELAKSAGITAADLNEMVNREPYGMITKYQRLAEYLAVSIDCIVNNDLTGVPETFFEKHSPGDYLKVIPQKQAVLGREAEDAVFRMEQERVAAFSNILSRLVLPYYKMRASSPGYDLLSYNAEGRPLYIEIKNSVKKNPPDFRLTAHEFDIAKKVTEEGYQYLIYTFSGWGTEDQKLEIKPFRTLLEENRIAPVNYVCNLREIRKEVSGITYHRMLRKLSQADLAATLDIPPACLCKYELGENICPVTVYQKLAAFFCIPIDDLLKWYPNPNLSGTVSVNPY